MTAPRGDGPRPFGADELAGVPGIRPDELSAEIRLARDIETVAARGTVRPSADFADRVMAAIEKEPVPAPVVAAGSALRHGAALGFLASLRDSFRVAFGGGFPVAVRAQAFALALLVTGVVAGGGVATAGALGVFDDRGSPPPTMPSPSTQPLPTVAPSESFDVPASPPSPMPSPLPSPSETPQAETPSPDDTDEPEETREPRETEKADDNSGKGSGDDSSGSGSGGDDNSGKGSDDDRETPRPTRDSNDDETPRPTDDSAGETPEPDDD